MKRVDIEFLRKIGTTAKHRPLLEGRKNLTFYAESQNSSNFHKLFINPSRLKLCSYFTHKWIHFRKLMEMWWVLRDFGNFMSKQEDGKNGGKSFRIKSVKTCVDFIRRIPVLSTPPIFITEKQTRNINKQLYAKVF